MSARASTERLPSPLVNWLRLAADHIVPATLCLLVAVVQLQLAVGYWNGQGVAAGLDGFERGWLVAHKVSGASFYLLVTLLFAVRAPRRGPKAGPLGVAVALAGVFVLSVQGLLPTVDPAPERMIPAVVLMIAGMVMSLVSLAFLGRFFGVLPEARGIAMRGPYSRIRHPLYLAEILIAAGLVLPVLSLWTVAIFLAFVGLQYWRALLEERALTVTFPDYAAYAARTWRIIPGIH